MSRESLAKHYDLASAPPAVQAAALAIHQYRIAAWWRHFRACHDQLIDGQVPDIVDDIVLDLGGLIL